MSTHETKSGLWTMSVADLKSEAAAVAALMQTDAPPSPDVRQRFIAIRTALFQRGVYDPVLVRFDSATAPRATNAEIAAQLTTIADSLA